jgi:hypothetical protein
MYKHSDETDEQQPTRVARLRRQHLVFSHGIIVATVVVAGTRSNLSRSSVFIRQADSLHLRQRDFLLSSGPNLAPELREIAQKRQQLREVDRWS